MYGVARKCCPSVMLCPVLVLAPAMCILSGIRVSLMLSIEMKNLDISTMDKKGKNQQDSICSIKNKDPSGIMLAIAFFLITYSLRSAWGTSETLLPIPHHAARGRKAVGSLPMTSEKHMVGFIIILQTMQMSRDAGMEGCQITAMANQTVSVGSSIWKTSYIS